MTQIIKLTPAQKQYKEIKENYKDCILFFRMGDFYETFYEDAKLCSKILDITLTSRHKNTENPIPMAGVPYHSAEKYIAGLVKAGYKIAIAEQIGNAVPGQLVPREVTNVVTPGTFLDEKFNNNFNYIAGIYYGIGSNKNIGNYHLAWGDFSIGEYNTKSFQNLESIFKFIEKLNLSEIVLDVDFPEKIEIESYIKNYSNIFISFCDIPPDYSLFLKNILQVQTLDSYGQSLKEGRGLALSLLFNYLKNTQKTSIKNIAEISYYGDDDKVILDDITIKNLEIFQSSYELNKKYSLFGVIDNTNTPMGGRLLRSILVDPIQNIDQINYRNNNIQYYFDNLNITNEIMRSLKLIGDLNRVVSILIYKKNSPFIWQKLRIFLSIILFENQYCIYELERLGLNPRLIQEIILFFEEIDNALKVDDFQEDINFIKDGYNSKIDELRKIAFNSDELLISYQQELISKTSLNNIKLRFVTNQGYYIEVTKKDSKLLESFSIRNDEKFDFIRRQTLKTAERYTSPYLDGLEKKVIQSKENLQKLEKEILYGFVSKLETKVKMFSELSKYISWLDIFSSFALYSKEKKWVKPIIVEDNCIDIEGGRHPVIHEFLPKSESFIPNDLKLTENKFVHIITGPNMGGKSTYLRQNALIVLLSHCGLWVPANYAKIGLVDGIFARVGSGDVLVKNQSTFMTEMIEVSNILHNSSSKSFIVLDELGRGTSTYDGMVLAREILIYIAEKLKSKTLFATHYHELISLEGKIESIENYSVSVYENNKNVVFLKKIVKGGANKSYGIDVAKLAGVPNEIIEKSKKYLKKIEAKNLINQPSMDSLFVDNNVSDLYKDKYNNLKKFIDNIDLNNITPIQAIGIIEKLKNDNA